MSTQRFKATLALASILAILSPAGVIAAPQDSTGNGGETARQNHTLEVPTQFATIQAAINASLPGGTVKILPGIYTEQITINKNLRLIGAGVDKTSIRAPYTLAPGSFGVRVIVDINKGATVAMSDLTVTGPGSGTCGLGSLSAGVFVVEGATLDLYSAAVTHIHDTPAAACFPFGVGIRVGAILGPVLGSAGHATIHDVNISDYQTDGISVLSHGSTATISDNTISGQGHTSGFNTNGVAIFRAIATVTNNIVSGNYCTLPAGCGPDLINDTQSTGISPGPGADPGTVIVHNEVTNNDVGIYVAGVGCCHIARNRISDNKLFGLVIQDGSNTASNDSISGGMIGIGVLATTVDTVATLRNERISGTTSAPIQAISSGGFKATAVVINPPGL